MLELLVVEGPNRGARYPLGPGASVIGRAAGCEVLLPDEGASRRHAQIVLNSDEVLVVDLGSQNGTVVNGIPLEAEQSVRVSVGARVGVASTVLLLGEQDPASEPPRIRSTVVVKAWPRDRALAEPDADKVLALVTETGRAGITGPTDLRKALAAAMALAGGVKASLFARTAAGLSLVATSSHSVGSQARPTSNAEEAAPDQAARALETEEAQALPLAGDELAVTLPGRGGRAAALLVVGAGSGGLAVRSWTQIFWAGLAPHVIALAERSVLRRDAQRARSHRRMNGGGGGVAVVAKSPVMRRLLQQVAKVAEADAPVLVLGESGSGKELIARSLHEASPRNEGPFVAVNAAAFPDQLLESELFGHVRGAFTGAVALKKGHFELAAGGTLFLDEVGELSDAAQKKLLRVLETKEFYRLGSGEALRTDARLVAATHRDLALAVKDGRFREDLYFRLAVVELRVPPLRERSEDRWPLVEDLLQQVAGRTIDVEPAAKERLLAYSFPGNVRELKNALERALILGDKKVIRLADLPDRLQQATAPRPADATGTLDEREKDYVQRMLEESGWNRTRAAERLGIDRRTLYNKMKRWGIVRPGDDEP